MKLDKKHLYFALLFSGFLFSLQNIAFATTDSTAGFNASIADTQSQPIMVDSGFINFPPVNAEQQSFLTNRGCPSLNPTVYIPFVEMKSTKTRYVFAGQEAASGQGICVNGISVNGSVYQIFYIVRRVYNQFVPITDRFIGKSSGAWTLSTTENRPIQTTPSFNADFQNVGGIYWKLWCYPSPTRTGVFPPQDQMHVLNNAASPIPEANNACVGGGTPAANPF